MNRRAPKLRTHMRKQWLFIIIVLHVFVSQFITPFASSDSASKSQNSQQLYCYTEEGIKVPFSLPDNIAGVDTVARFDDMEELTALKNQGYQFVGRYLGPSSWWKALTKEEAALISAAGLKILSIYEYGNDDPLDGEAGGLRDGKTAYECAKELGIPTNAILYFAMDDAVQDYQMDAIEEYLRAARTQTGEYEVGIYGPYNVIEEMYKREACKGFWQCIGWSLGNISDHHMIYQASGSTRIPELSIKIDLNSCTDMDAAGMWAYENADGILDNSVGAAFNANEEIRITKKMLPLAKAYLYSEQFINLLHRAICQ